MKVTTLRFGELEIPDDKIIVMSKPILGFENLKRYCLIEREDCEPFLWYQSIDDPASAFPVVNPLLFCPDYKIEVNPKEVEELNIRDVKSVETYAIVTITPEPDDLSINLQGPILINTETRLAKQLVLVNSGYEVKYYVMRQGEMSAESGPVETTATV